VSECDQVKINNLDTCCEQVIAIFCYLPSLNSQQVFKISSTPISARTDMSVHGISRPFKRPGAAANGFTAIKFFFGELPLHFQ
jgi:hypothetical protein